MDQKYEDRPLNFGEQFETEAFSSRFERIKLCSERFDVLVDTNFKVFDAG